MKTNFNTRKFQGGAYATVLSVVVIAIAVLVNLMVTRLDITADMTSDRRYSLTEETISMLQELDDEITFYYLASSGDSIDIFDKLLAQYTKYGDTVTLVNKDPVLNPKFASQYTSQTVEQYSIIVVNETNGRYRYVPYSDMLIEEYSLDYTTYQYSSQITGLDMEGQLNSAIGYVTSEDLPTLYEVSGHGMQELGSSVVAMLEKANIQVNSSDNALDLLTSEEIPQDCDVILIHAPQTDFTEDETALLSDFLANGGKIIFVLSYLNTEHPNLMSLVESYGIEMTNGLVLESSSRNYIQAPYILVPNVTAHEITSDVAETKYVVAQTSSGLKFSDNSPESVSRKAFLTTSSSAYIKSGDFTTYYQEDGDESGTFYLGVYAEDGETGAEVVVFSSYYIFNEAYANNSTFGNINLLLNSVNTLADSENTTTAVRVVSLVDDDYLVLTDAQMNTVGVFTVILLPIAFLAVGIVWVVYRKKHS